MINCLLFCFLHYELLQKIYVAPVRNLLELLRLRVAIKAVIIKAIHIVKSGAEQVVGEHKDYVNALASHPETGASVASVSDDQTCCIWSVDSNDSADDTISFPLTSPGMAVCWHPKEPSKVEASAH